MFSVPNTRKSSAFIVDVTPARATSHYRQSNVHLYSFVCDQFPERGKIARAISDVLCVLPTNIQNPIQTLDYFRKHFNVMVSYFVNSIGNIEYSF